MDLSIKISCDVFGVCVLRVLCNKKGKAIQ